jgi:hypothetical protein
MILVKRNYCIFKTVTDTNTKQHWNSVETHKLYLLMLDVFSISYFPNVSAISNFFPYTPQLSLWCRRLVYLVFLYVEFAWCKVEDLGCKSCRSRVVIPFALEMPFSFSGDWSAICGWCVKINVANNNLISFLAVLKFFHVCICKPCRSQWPRGLKHEPSFTARTLVSWIRIPHEAWMSMCVYSVFVLFCV